MSMLSDVRVICPNCEKLIEQTITVPEPNFMAERMKDSAVEFWDDLICEHCEHHIEYRGSNSYYELYITSDEVDEADFLYSDASYEFDEYDSDESIESDGVKGIINNRNIESLYHFSKIENLEAIANQGLIPRAQLKDGDYKFTDVNRSDGFLNANCISVSFPQYRMFFIKRVQNPQQNWVVLELSPELILDKESAFFERNAASRVVQTEIIENRKLATAFEKMFDDIDELPSRKERKLPDNYPSDPQAEILVFDKIDRDYIVAAHFANEAMLDKYKDQLNGIEPKVSPELFDNRVDHEWL
ncbi:TPA: DarT ssDNA thymidine ADP-ribosyltransferase family protein [Vibrio parahaemolyticus]|uniref:DarT ssDNA thymidine ADP-ribosyltransferase family protein n=1 Tax=Vibrio parahaemolyticus TaxID=670 RepID=UPI0027361F2C|nr:DarT ssDNA thymidine ADP-ribosyltransferase family protein [Vibrio parahaemolyticus]WLI84386.1 DarT ssDNA thymidine ADP-ribosyltransferase family protein [Vibrio parahaemolyticus]